MLTKHYFTQDTFALLQLLHKEKSVDIYLANSDAFCSSVQDPFQDVFHEVAQKLPRTLKKLLITEKDIFCRTHNAQHILDFYWGAFSFHRGAFSGAKLFMWINHHMLQFGLCSGPVNKDKPWLQAQNNTSIANPPADQWLQDKRNNIEFSTTLTKEEVLSFTRQQFVAFVVSTFEKIYSRISLFDETTYTPHKNIQYSIKKCAADTHISYKKISMWLRTIRHKKHAIIYGPPGTGKTYLAERLAQVILHEKAGISTTVQFHSSYSYEDFIQGLRPQEDGSYRITNGTFLRFCEQAKQQGAPSVLIIDEINRAAIDRVFGELMYLLEYRDRSITLLSGETFSIPPQVHIIGTMNTADKSIAILDYALRRRFAFIPLYPDYSLIHKFPYDKKCNIKALTSTLQSLNNEISDQNFQIGTSFFLIADLADHIENIWRFQIEPYIEEYFFNELHRVERYRWNKICKKITQI